MSKEKDPNRKKWLLNDFRVDLREAVTLEGKKEGRTAPKQVEAILAERYGLPFLSEEDKGSGREQARAKKDRPTVKRPAKNAQKDKNAAA